MTASAEYGPYGGLRHYMKLGYVPIDLEPEAASKTVEYAFDDWTIARMADKMGRRDVAERYFRRAQNWRNVFDPKTGFVRAQKIGWNVPRAVRPGAFELRQRLHGRQRVAVFLVYAAR
jgi:putative alpha-1,2-mannosidase